MANHWRIFQEIRAKHEIVKYCNSEPSYYDYKTQNFNSVLTSKKLTGEKLTDEKLTGEKLPELRQWDLLFLGQSYHQQHLFYFFHKGQANHEILLENITQINWIQNKISGQIYL